MNYLLDTCIISKLRKIKAFPDDKLREWFSKHSDHHYFIHILTIGEIQKGISRLKDSEREKRIVLEEWLINELIPRFEDRIVGMDSETALIWGRVCGEAQKKGVLLPVIDSLLAASALQHHLVLVTENGKDFIHTGCTVFNPS